MLFFFLFFFLSLWQAVVPVCVYTVFGTVKVYFYSACSKSLQKHTHAHEFTCMSATIAPMLIAALHRGRRNMSHNEKRRPLFLELVL